MYVYICTYIQICIYICSHMYIHIRAYIHCIYVHFNSFWHIYAYVKVLNTNTHEDRGHTHTRTHAHSPIYINNIYVLVYIFVERWKRDAGIPGTLIHINIVPAQPQSTDGRSVQEIQSHLSVMCTCVRVRVRVRVCVCVFAPMNEYKDRVAALYKRFIPTSRQFVDTRMCACTFVYTRMCACMCVCTYIQLPCCCTCVRVQCVYVCKRAHAYVGVLLSVSIHSCAFLEAYFSRCFFFFFKWSSQSRRVCEFSIPTLCLRKSVIQTYVEFGRVVCRLCSPTKIKKMNFSRGICPKTLYTCTAHACTLTRTCTHTHTYTRTHVHTYTRTHTRAHAHTHTHILTHIPTHTRDWCTYMALLISVRACVGLFSYIQVFGIVWVLYHAANHIHACFSTTHIYTAHCCRLCAS